LERKGYEMLKGIFKLDKDWNEYSQEEQKEIVAKKAKVLLHLVETNPRLEEALIGHLKQEYIASVEKKAKEYILGGFPTLSKMNNKSQKEK
jgi:hypothetical protein